MRATFEASILPALSAEAVDRVTSRSAPSGCLWAFLVKDPQLELLRSLLRGRRQGAASSSPPSSSSSSSLLSGQHRGAQSQRSRERDKTFTQHEVTKLADALVEVFMQDGNRSMERLVREVVRVELQTARQDARARSAAVAARPTERRSQLFRNNRLGCRVLCSYAQAVGRPFLVAALEPEIAAFCAEVTAAATPAAGKGGGNDGKGASKAEADKETQAQVLRIAQSILHGLVRAAPGAPRPFKQFCRMLRATEEQHLAMGAFIFLRFIIPAIISPQRFGISPVLVSSGAHGLTSASASVSARGGRAPPQGLGGVPVSMLSSTQRRGLMGVAKAIQGLANAALFAGGDSMAVRNAGRGGEDDDKVAAFQNFVHKNLRTVVKLLEALCDTTATPDGGAAASGDAAAAAASGVVVGSDPATSSRPPLAVRSTLLASRGANGNHHGSTSSATTSTRTITPAGVGAGAGAGNLGASNTGSKPRRQHSNPTLADGSDSDAMVSARVLCAQGKISSAELETVLAADRHARSLLNLDRQGRQKQRAIEVVRHALRARALDAVAELAASCRRRPRPADYRYDREDDADAETEAETDNSGATAAATATAMAAGDASSMVSVPATATAKSNGGQQPEEVEDDDVLVNKIVFSSAPPQPPLRAAGAKANAAASASSSSSVSSSSSLSSAGTDAKTQRGKSKRGIGHSAGEGATDSCSPSECKNSAILSAYLHDVAGGSIARLLRLGRGAERCVAEAAAKAAGAGAGDTSKNGGTLNDKPVHRRSVSAPSGREEGGGGGSSSSSSSSSSSRPRQGEDDDDDDDEAGWVWKGVASNHVNICQCDATSLLSWQQPSTWQRRRRRGSGSTRHGAGEGKGKGEDGSAAKNGNGGGGAATGAVTVTAAETVVAGTPAEVLAALCLPSERVTWDSRCAAYDILERQAAAPVSSFGSTGTGGGETPHTRSTAALPSSTAAPAPAPAPAAAGSSDRSRLDLIRVRLRKSSVLFGTYNTRDVFLLRAVSRLSRAEQQQQERERSLRNGSTYGAGVPTSPPRKGDGGMGLRLRTSQSAPGPPLGRSRSFTAAPIPDDDDGQQQQQQRGHENASQKEDEEDAERNVEAGDTGGGEEEEEEDGEEEEEDGFIVFEQALLGHGGASAAGDAAAQADCDAMVAGFILRPHRHTVHTAAARADSAAQDAAAGAGAGAGAASGRLQCSITRFSHGPKQKSTRDSWGVAWVPTVTELFEGSTPSGHKKAGQLLASLRKRFAQA